MPQVTITDEAATQLAGELSGRILRISFTTGCGGSGYRLASADEPQEGDTIVEISGVRVAFDDMASKNLDGAVIERDDAEDGYLLNHPSAVTAVWCG